MTQSLDGYHNYVPIDVTLIEVLGSTGPVIHYVPILLCDIQGFYRIMLVLYPYSLFCFPLFLIMSSLINLQCTYLHFYFSVAGH